MSGRVLIVEDEPLLAFDLEEIIKDGGFEVAGSVTCMSEAMELVNTRRIDAAIVDYWLNKEASDTLILELGKREVPTLIVSGDELAIEKFPGVTFLIKPARADVVLEHLRQLQLG